MLGDFSYVIKGKPKPRQYRHPEGMRKKREPVEVLLSNTNIQFLTLQAVHGQDNNGILEEGEISATQQFCLHIVKK